MQSDQKIGLCLLIGLFGFAAALGVGRREHRADPLTNGEPLESIAELEPVRELVSAAEANDAPSDTPSGSRPEDLVVVDIPAVSRRVDPEARDTYASRANLDARDSATTHTDEPAAASVADTPRPALSDQGPTTLERAVQARQSPAYRSYTVRAGDTLSGIASRELGDVGRYFDVYKANQDRMAHPDALRPGQVLRIPIEQTAALASSPDSAALR